MSSSAVCALYRIFRCASVFHVPCSLQEPQIPSPAVSHVKNAVMCVVTFIVLRCLCHATYDYNAFGGRCMKINEDYMLGMCAVFARVVEESLTLLILVVVLSCSVVPVDVAFRLLAHPNVRLD